MPSPPHPRRQALLRHIVITAALLTYLFDPVDVVWRTVQHTSNPRAYERLAFTAAALLLAVALALSTRVPHKQHRATANLLYITALAFLLPWEGALILILGEILRTLFRAATPARHRTPIYLSALLAMTLFAFTLQDRLADLLFGATFVLAIFLDFVPPSQSLQS